MFSAGLAVAGQIDQPKSENFAGTLMLAPIPGGARELEVERPAGRSSRAGIRGSGARVAGAPEPLTLSSSVVVDADAETLRRLVGRRGVVRPGPARGFAVIETNSVEQAVALAHQLMREPGIGSVELDVEQPRALRAPTDPFFPGQWPLRNLANPAADANAVPAWDLGYTGLGVVVGVVEFAWQVDHPDLAANFIPDASMPPAGLNSHATSVAGVIAADNDNGLGGVGVAYDAGLARLIYGTSVQTASSLLHRNDLNDIKNNSWGPSDNNRVSYMAAVERAAIAQGVAEGRGGLGEIYVWAAGNGGINDRLDYDPYASSRFTIAVGAIGDQNVRATYNESGSSMFVVAHSSGNVQGVFSTALNGYTTAFGGTSASAPLVSGVIALMLQANPDLTWRDVQHVLAATTWQVDPDNESWAINAAGRHVSDDFGFGAVDAHAAVVAAESWVNVGTEVHADSGRIVIEQAVPDNNLVGVSAFVTLDRLVRVESVEVIVNVECDAAGDIRLELVSPGGTVSTLSMPRFDPTDDLVDYVFTTTRCWGESSGGTWTVRVSDERATQSTFWNDVRVIAHGPAWTSDCPADLNGDGALTHVDVQLFLGAYHAGDPVADVIADGTINFFDLQAYLNRFSNGCP